MIRQTFAALVLVALAGCSASSTINPFAGNDGEKAQLAAYAASNHYPADIKPSTDARIAALINPKNETIRIVNFSDQPVRNANVWVNGTFVRKIDTLPPHASIVLNRSEFYDASGQDMARLKVTPTRIELQSGDHLYSVMDATVE